MLHELLVVLAGFDSALVSDDVVKSNLHPSENAMIAQIQVLGSLHAKLSRIIVKIQSSEVSVSPAGHAVARSVSNGVVVRFQAKLIDIEKNILSRDSAFVGGDSFVSLTQIVTLTVRQWQRLFQYSVSLLKDIVGNTRSGPEIIKILRRDAAVTGYQEVAALIMSCLIAAEKSWMTQVSCLIVYGSLPATSQDFMVVENVPAELDDDVLDHPKYILVTSRIPPCIDTSTANDILIIGSCLDQTKGHSQILNLSQSALSNLSYPLDSDAMAATIASCKRQILTHVIRENVDQAEASRLLYFLRHIVLLGSNEFTDALFCEYSGAHMDDSDLNHLFSSAFNRLLEDCPEERSIDHKFITSVVLTSKSSTSAGFDDLTFNVPCNIKFQLPGPFRILVSQKTLRYYSELFAFFLAVRLAMYKLSHRTHRTGQAIPLNGFPKLKLKLLWDAIWQHIQFAVDVEFKRMGQLFDNSYEIVIERHEACLKNILDQSLITRSRVATVLRRLLLGSSSISPQEVDKLLAELMEEISGLDVLTKDITHLLVLLEPLNT